MHNITLSVITKSICHNKHKHKNRRKEGRHKKTSQISIVVKTQNIIINVECIVK